MDAWPVLIAAVVGIVLGVIAGRWRARAAGAGELATARERASARETQANELTARLRAIESEQERLRLQAGEAQAARAAADARALAERERADAAGAALAERERAQARAGEEGAQARARIAELETRLAEERRAAAEKLALLDEARAALAQSFRALSADALKSNNQAFLELANASFARVQEGAKGDLELKQQAIAAQVKPLAENLDKLSARLGALDQAQAKASGTLEAQIQLLSEGQRTLGRETRNLVEALRRPHVRGRWGETQLRRVVEMSGMQEHCDFVEQAVAEGESNLRPDLVVRLPGGKSVVVDAKAALSAYLEALEASDDEQRRDRLKAHARHIGKHIDALAAKAYWEQFRPSPEFVVLFIPGDGILSAAFEHDPDLMEYAMRSRVVLATPTTLIAVLRAVAYGWRQEQLSQNAEEISALGRELYKRVGDLIAPFANLRKHLDNAVESYNKAVGSLEARLLPQARRFRELGADDGRELPLLDGVERIAKELSAPELQPPAANG